MTIDKRKILWFLLVVTTCMVGLAFGLVDADFYWQSKLGMQEFLNHDFNYSSQLLWGSTGLGTYLDHEWLCNILFYIARTPFWAKFMICLCTGIVFGCFTKPRVQLLGVILLYALLFCRIKAASFSVLFLFFEILLLDSECKDWKWLVKLFLVLILWNNTHSGSVILFFLVAGAYFLFQSPDKKRLFIVGLVCLALIGVTPYGYRLMAFNISHIFSGDMSEVVIDWHPLDCSKAMGWISLSVILLSLYKAKIRWHLVAVVGISIMTFKSERFGVYLFPFLCLADYKVLTPMKWVYLPVTCLLTIMGVVTGLRGGESYNFSYGDRMASIIREGDGLFNDYDVTSGRDIKGFINGAYPLCRERTLDSLVLRYYGGDESIEKLIAYYNLDRFAFCKYNMQCGFYHVTNPLYDYLSARGDKYKCLYDDDLFVYFETR